MIVSLSGESGPLLVRPVLFLRLLQLSSVISAWLSPLGFTSDRSTRGRLDSVIFLLRCNIGFKVVLSGSSEYFGILLDCWAVLLEIGFKVEALIASDAVQTFFEENFLEIFLLVSESFRVIFRYNTRPPCLCTDKKEKYENRYLCWCSLNWCGESDEVPGAKAEEETKVKRFKGGRAEMQVNCVAAIGSRIHWCQVVKVCHSARGIHWLLPHLAHLSIFQGGQKVKLHFHRSTSEAWWEVPLEKKLWVLMF